MRLTIFETTSGEGHQLTYVRQMLSALLGEAEGESAVVDPSAITLALSRSAIESEAFAHQLGRWVDRVSVHPMESVTFGRDKKVASVQERVALLEGALEATRPTRLLVPSADGLVQMLGTKRGLVADLERLDLVMHRGSFAYPAAGLKVKLARRFGLWAMSRVPRARVHFVDVLAWEWLEKKGHRFAARADVLPDPVDEVEARDKASARGRLGLPLDAPLIVSAGVQDVRKGIPELALALAAARRGGGALEAKLVLAGRITAPVRASLEALPAEVRGAIIEMDRYLSDEELADAIAAGDLIAACQPSHVGLSNIALRGAAAGRPSLGSDFGWFGRVIPAFDLGWTGPVRDAEAFGRVIARAVAEAPGWSPSERTKRLVAFHSHANFRATVRGWFGAEGGGVGWRETVGS